MKTRFLPLGFLILLQLALSVSVRAEDCETNASNMAEVRACLDDKLEADLSTAIDSMHDFVQPQNAEAAKLLLTAQTSWRKFAEDSCNYSVAARQTAELENDARLACWSTFVRARIKVLNAYRRNFGKADF
ncbi:lysozyme inhibitor LprI family protein [Phyllobacterium sp. YR531]|uniref:lysozyme inhibitor LprI family protein n=1 Tax=Phyllobacterium sp. YR531 TaxID=1144343 RepID=UPI00026F7DEF|nr:lysozyme inhibitor LprI family protein [Phyllobacterium sp. YR531]EJN06320.1 Protein of unknown function (DUF1311) [Phyllobacterium sp. YR531]